MKRLLFIPFISASLLCADSQTPDFKNLFQTPQLNRESFRPIPPIPQQKSAALSAGLSFLLPGLGHYYINDTKTAYILSGSTGAGLSLMYSHFATPEVRYAGFWTTEICWTYGIYAAYRDARLYNGEASYSFKRMPKDGFFDLAAAPFKFSVLKKPEVWGGFLGSFAIATLIGHFASQKTDRTAPISLSVFSTIYPLTAFLVGISEESLFRGYLQSQLCEISNPVTGIILSSLLFGAAHIGNAKGFSKEARRSYYTFCIPFISAAGGYLGWMSYKNASLQESVALHGWYDFTLFALEAAASQAGMAAISGNKEFSISFSF